MRVVEAVSAVETLEILGDPDTEVVRVEHDSRAVEAGDLFCCVTGATVDGHDMAAEAVAAGATSLLVQRPLDLPVAQVPLDLPVAQVVVADVRAAMGPVSAKVCGNPSEDLTVLAVTGTNGKTTTTRLLGSVLSAAGMRTEVLGTLSGERTTPEAPVLQRRLAAWRDGGVQAVAMEVSSHALAQRRVDGTRFRVSGFTNLSRDHLDYHRDMDAYFEAKARLFDPELSDAAVVLVDGPYGRRMLDSSRVPTTPCSMSDLQNLELGATSSRFDWRGHRVELGIGGRFNVANALLAAEMAVVVGVAPDVVAQGLGEVTVIPGRFEPVDVGQPFTVLVDYAHTPDGLAHVLSGAREVVGDATVIVVFGCGGNRDREKRPEMGGVAARLADTVVVTADNSRDEPTEAILAAVVEGADAVPAREKGSLHVEPDRRSAIALALSLAGEGDVVVVAGKGHETTQTIGTAVIPFDDRVVVREELARLLGVSRL